LANLKQATVEEITAVPGIGVATAAAVRAALAAGPGSAGLAAGTTPVSDDRTAEQASG
jgi:excinuclease ABC subunit C